MVFMVTDGIVWAFFGMFFIIHDKIME